ncbi:MAG: hypothetical protein HQ498_04905 [Pseudohongiella sp.]|nr:hypothetical protein [Pseudohongiella sp.]
MNRNKITLRKIGKGLIGFVVLVGVLVTLLYFPTMPEALSNTADSSR